MEFRDRDVLDYALVSVVSLLAYLQLPWRPRIRGGLRAAWQAVGDVDATAGGLPVWAVVLAGLFLGIVMLVVIVSVPSLQQD